MDGVLDKPYEPEDELELELRISQKDLVAEDTCSFRLESPDGTSLPAFEPGAHVKVKTPCGAIRKYSLCGDMRELDAYQITVQKEEAGTGGSASLLEDTMVGDFLSVSPPENAFPLVKNAKRYLFIAGGIGITPILSMISFLEAEGNMAWVLYYLTKNPRVTAFLPQLMHPKFKSRVHIHHSQENPDGRLDLWPYLEKANTAQIYCCGPRGLMEDVQAMTGHWSPGNIHFESFITGGRPQEDDIPFRVRVSSTGEELEVPVGQTILGVLREHGYRVSSSCESGTCGTCRTRLKAGQADHRDMVLMPDEQGTQIMLCVSRARSTVLELDL